MSGLLPETAILWPSKDPIGEIGVRRGVQPLIRGKRGSVGLVGLGLADSEVFLTCTSI